MRWASRVLDRMFRQGRREPSVLTPDEIPRDEVDVSAALSNGVLRRVTLVLTRRRLLLTNKTYTKDLLSIPLADVTAMKSTRDGICITYRDAGAPDQIVCLKRTVDADEDDVIWMMDQS